VTVMAFLSLFLVGFTIIFGLMSFYYRELRSNSYNVYMALANGLNVIFLFLIVIVYTFVYASDTKWIGKLFFFYLGLCVFYLIVCFFLSQLIADATSLVFSWSYYLLFASLITSILSTVFFMYVPVRSYASALSK
jgi:hypothetical protein